MPDVDEVRLQILRFPNEPFLGIELTAEPRVRYSIETSPDLTNWTTWQFPFINSLSQALFTEWNPAPTNRFFRARQGP